MHNKSILIVSESFEIGGLETYIRGEIIALTSLGWKVHFACGNRYINKLMPDCIVSVHSNLNLNPDSTISEIIDSTEKLREIIKEHNIEFIHAHPFTSFFPAQIAAELENSKFIITLHGPSSLNSYNGPIYDFLLNEVTFKSSPLVVCISEEVKQLAHPHVKDEHIYLQPNVITIPHKINPKKGDSNWLVVSRLDWEKIPGIFDFIKLAKEVGLGTISVAGDGAAKQVLINWLTENNLIETVEFLGFQTDIKNLIENSKGVAGMGRVVLEGLSLQKPVVLIGYNHVKGLLDLPLFLEASKFNFSGRNVKNVNSVNLKKQLEKINSLEIKKISDYLKENYDESKIWQQFEKRILDIPSAKKGVLVDLFNYIYSNSRNNSTPFFQSQAIIDILGKLSQSSKYEHKKLPTAFYNYYNSFSKKVDTYFQQQITDLQSELNSKNIDFEQRINELNDREQKLLSANTLLSALESTLKKDIENLKDQLNKKNESIEELKLRLIDSETQKNKSIEELKLRLIDSETQKNKSIEELKLRIVDSEAQKNESIEELKLRIVESEAQKNKYIEELKLRLIENSEQKNKIEKQNEDLIFRIDKIQIINEQLLTQKTKLEEIYNELINSNPFKALKLLRSYRIK